MNTCETCRHYKQTDDEEKEGKCHRYPPQHRPSVVHLLVKDRDKQYQADQDEKMDEGEYLNLIFNEASAHYSWGFPAVDADDWCGEWQAK